MSANGSGEAVAPVAMRTVGLTAQQRAAAETLDRDVFLEAGAGTGKTSVLVERYRRVALDPEVGPGRVLAFTFTERAAEELRRRVVADLSDLLGEAIDGGSAEQAMQLRAALREAQDAPIGTIHGFCRRMLAAHATEAGLDPSFRVIDEPEGQRLAERAFADALASAAPGEDADLIELAAAYGIDYLRSLVVAAHDALRVRGMSDPDLPPAPQIDVPAALARLGRAAERASEAGVAAGAAGLAAIQRMGELARLAGDNSQLSLVALEQLPPKGRDAKALSASDLQATLETAERAHAEAVAALASAENVHLYESLRNLVRAFAARYGELKAARAGLDFEDLQLHARDLLRERPAIAAEWRQRLSHIMVDEFQDTNAVQVELISALRGPDTRLFTVGDSFQSIYRFRDADSAVFDGCRADCEGDTGCEVMPLTGNFRSRPGVLAGINALGGALFADFNQLHPGAEPEDPPAGEGPEVELLISEGASWNLDGDWSRARQDLEMAQGDPSPPLIVAEARFLSRRLAELCEGGVARAEIAVLLRAFTHVRVFEAELEAAGLRPYVAGGRGYWSAQQVEDVRELLATLANPLDDQALLGALGAFCAVAPDTMWLLRSLAGEASPLWPTLVEHFGDGQTATGGIDGTEAKKLRRFHGAITDLRRRGGRLPLEALIERAVEGFSYDVAILARANDRDDDGLRRIANLRKLMKLARDFEAAEGRDLRGFVEHLRRSAAREALESEAATVAESHDGVRVMTVHAAKGLEFGVVAVANLGRRLLLRRPEFGLGRATEDDAGANGLDPAAGLSVGLRLARIGAPRVSLFDMEELTEEAERDDSEEERRVAHVAATRARRHLLLSGTLSRRWEKDIVPGTPVVDRLLHNLIASGVVALPLADGEIELPPRLATGGQGSADLGGRLGIRVSVPGTLPRPGARPPEQALEVQSGARPPLGERGRAIEPAISHVSYSALNDYGRCGYRFHLERVVGLRARAREGEPGAGGPAFGGAVHALLEWSARNGWVEPSGEGCRDALARAGLAATAEQVDRARRLCRGCLSSELLRELRGLGAALRAEVPFMFSLGRFIVRGRIDLLAAGADLTTVVDYKTDRLDGAVPEALVTERYALQRDIYALAASQRGRSLRVAHLFLEAPGDPAVALFGEPELTAARKRITATLRDLSQGAFEVTDSPHAALCHDCPALDVLCPYEKERTLAGSTPGA